MNSHTWYRENYPFQRFDASEMTLILPARIIKDHNIDKHTRVGQKGACPCLQIQFTLVRLGLRSSLADAYCASYIAPYKGYEEGMRLNGVSESRTRNALQHCELLTPCVTVVMPYRNISTQNQQTLSTVMHTRSKLRYPSVANARTINVSDYFYGGGVKSVWLVNAPRETHKCWLVSEFGKFATHEIIAQPEGRKAKCILREYIP